MANTYKGNLMEATHGRESLTRFKSQIQQIPLKNQVDISC